VYGIVPRTNMCDEAIKQAVDKIIVEVTNIFIMETIFCVILLCIITYIMLKWDRYKKFVENKKLENEFVEFQKIQKKL